MSIEQTDVVDIISTSVAPEERFLRTSLPSAGPDIRC
jgi:hypothetical protein